MRKLLLSIAAVGMLAGCGEDDIASSQPETEKKTVENPVTVDYLQDRIREGMDYDAYAVEIQSWAEKGQADIQGTVEAEGNPEVSGDIIQVSDGFLAVATDGKEITEVKSFPTPEEAKTYLNENL